MLESNVIVQDPPERTDVGSGDFGTAFYWFRRGRGGPDAWNAVLGRVGRGELGMAEADKRGINEELQSETRVLPMTKEELASWAALPASARRRRLAATFGGDRRVRVVPANSIVVEPASRTPGHAPVRTHEDERAEQRREQDEARREQDETEQEEEEALAAEAAEAKQEVQGAAGAGLLTEDEEDYMRIVEGQEAEAEAMGEAEVDKKKDRVRPQIRFEPEADGEDEEGEDEEAADE